MINLTFVWQSPKRQPWQPVKFGGGVVRRRRHGRSLLYAMAFDNEFNHREAAFKRLYGANPATSCTNLVSFRPIICEFTLLKRAIFAATRPQFNDRPSFATLAFRNGLEYHSFDSRIVIGHHLCTYCINLMRFGASTPEFNT